MVGECFDANTKILFKEDAIRELLEDNSEDGLAATDPNIITDELDSGILKNIIWGYMEFIPMINADRNRGLHLYAVVVPTCSREGPSRRGGRMPYDSEIADGHRDAQLCPPSNLARSLNARRLSLGGFEPSASPRSPSRMTSFFSLFRR